MAKTKRFMDGGYVPPNQYPFANPNSVQVGERQEPLEGITGDQEPVTMYKRGGKVKKYADGGDVIETPADVADRKKREEMERAYNRSLRSEGMEGPSKPSKPKKPSSMMSDIGSRTNPMGDTYKKGGCAKGYAKGGMIDGIAQRGKTKCKIC